MKFTKDNASEFGSKSSRKGIENKMAKNVRSAFEKLIQNNIEQMEVDLKSLTAESRLNIIVKMSAFILPKLKNIEIETETNAPAENSELIQKLLLVNEVEYDKIC